MKNVMILVSGMPGTGKTNFAEWLSSHLCAPLVCYDHIKEKTLSIMQLNGATPEQQRLFGNFPLDFFWFNTEEIMKSSSLLIVEYFFANLPLVDDVLDNLTCKYQYETIHVHLDASMEVAHQRFHERNQNNPGIEGMRPKEIPFEHFSKGTQQNKDFRYGNRFIYVDTTDFSTVSYEDIAVQVKKHIMEVIE